MNEKYMLEAIRLAKLGCGFVNPNPMVGAVIVKDGQIIGIGYHERYKKPHAEVNALNNCIQSPKGATMYITLEPCCHHGSNPPCTDAIIKNQISKVIIGSSDPNPVVSGKGVEILKDNNIEVVENFLKDECDKINRVFFHYIQNKLPYVVMKYAMTIDGKIATYTGKSKWISNEKSRANVQKDRHRYMGIMVGVDTVIADNPILNCRLENLNSPIRIICDTNLRTPINSNIVNTAKDYKTIIATKCIDKQKHKDYIEKGCYLIIQEESQNDFLKTNREIDLKLLMKTLGEMSIDSILLEGGSKLNYSALKSQIVNKVQAYISPQIFGGENAKTPVSGEGIDDIKDSFKLSDIEVSNLDGDILLEGRVEYCLQE